uniref:beta strand repeat-containing protein n=1 Tax=Microvirga flavescens TaxID=2249811 RepID=UPI003CCB6EF2
MASGPTRWNLEAQISSDQGLNNSAMAVASDGTTMVVWQDRRSDGTVVNFARLVSFDGELIRQFEVAPPGGIGGYVQGGASVSVLANGNFVVGWNQETFFGDTNIVSQVYTTAGDVVLTNPGVVSYQTGYDHDVSVFGNPAPAWANGDEGYRAVWERGGSIYTRGFHKDGYGLTDYEYVLVAPSANGTVSKPTGIYLSDGTGLVAYRYETVTTWPGQDPVVTYGIAFKYASGSTGIVGVSSGDDAVLDYSLIAMPNNGFLVTWSSGGINTPYSTRSQYYDATGVKSGGEIVLSTGVPVYAVKTAQLPTGVTVYTWVETTASGALLKARLYSNATPIASEFVVGTAVPATYGGLINPEIISHNDGRFTITWTNAQNSSGGPIRGQTYDTRPSTGWEWNGGINADSYVGTIGSDTLRGGGGSDRLSGYEGNDSLEGGDLHDTLKGGSGDDTLNGGEGNDVLNGGAGNDFASYANASSGVSVDLNNPNGYNSGEARGDSYQSIEGVIGSSGDDTISGTANAETFVGGDGNDVLDGRGGSDTLNGGAGNDTYYVDDAGDKIFDTSGSDKIFTSIDWTLQAGLENLAAVDRAATTPLVLTGNGVGNIITGNAGANKLDGGGGDDTLDGGAGADQLIGGAGDDWADYSSAAQGVVVSLLNFIAQTGDAAGDTFDSIENLRGSAFDDTLIGNDANNTIEGGLGDDALYGGGGADVLNGGGGWNLVTYQFSTAGSGITLNLKTGGHTGEAAGDQFININAFVGTTWSDTFIGSDGYDEFYGYNGNDSLSGGKGSDYLRGDDGNDTLVGGSGADTLNGSSNYDGTDDTGFDWASYADAEASVTAYLEASLQDQATGDAAGDVYIGIEGLIGSNFGDKLYGFSKKASFLDGGAGNDSLYGGTGDDTLEGGLGADSMVGGTGNDTYYVDDAGDTVSDIGGAKDKVITTISYTLAAGLEDAEVRSSVATATQVNLGGNGLNNVLTGHGGANSLDGGAGNDTLVGNGGNDTFEGGLGADSMVGGTGNDTYYVDDAGDSITDAGGRDKVVTTISYTLGAGLEDAEVRSSVAAGTRVDLTGNGSDNVLTGHGGANSLDGGSGADTLIGGGGNDTFEGGLGADSMVGGTGNDIYYIDHFGDTITDAGGHDKVIASRDYTLGTGLEDAEVRSSVAAGTRVDLTGNGSDNVLTGHGGANSLDGGSGADTLIGNGGNDTFEGGLGADSMVGGTGNDTYYVDDAGDTITDAGGRDKVVTTISYTLAAGLEDAEVRSSVAAGTRVDLTGNGSDNVLTGHAGANSLDGGVGNDTLIGNGGNDTFEGGLGADSMVGGTGNDTYYVDDAGDTITDAGGRDKVVTTISYTLAAGLEDAEVRSSVAAGTRVDLTGNGSDNVLTGHAGANSLDGGVGNDTLIGNGGNDAFEGGLGADSMVGGTGNDTYYVDDAGDTITDAGGRDKVVTTISYTLAAGLEDAEVRSSVAAGTRVDLTGNGSDNVLTGHAGANSLDGGVGNDTLIGNGGNDTFEGGLGADSMVGGTGNDTYYVDDAGDTITDAGGRDKVVTTISYTLAAGLEDAEVRSSVAAGTRVDLTGNGSDNVLTGHGGANSLDGGSGADTLIGNGGNDTFEGGLGADSMVGGTGNDTYYVDDAGDTITDAGGRDKVVTTISYTLAAGLEDAEVRSSVAAGTRVDLTGNGSDNVLTGHAGANSLDGGVGNDTLIGNGGNDTFEGGLGADSMVGGTGNDTYYVDDAGDTITDAGGRDKVVTTISYTLAAGLEDAEVRSSVAAGTRVDLTGNGLDNVLTGHAGANSLDGGSGADTLIGGGGNDTFEGGLGADSMVGGTGNDIYYVDDAGDTITDAGGRDK